MVSIYSRDTFNPSLFSVSRIERGRVTRLVLFYLSHFNLADLVKRKEKNCVYVYIYIFFSTQIKSLVQASLPRTIYPRTSDHFIGEDNRGKKTLARISADTICTHVTIFSNLLDEQPRFVACDLTSSPLHAH